MLTVRAIKNESTVPFEHDAVLWPYLTASNEAAADIALTSLLTEHVEPRLREIVPYKLRPYAGQMEESEERADVCHEILLQLLTQLTALRQAPQQNIIRNFRSYVAVAAYRGCYDYLRRKYPQRYSLKHKLRYTLTNTSGLACWQQGEEWLAGVSAWQGRADVCSESQLQELRQLRLSRQPLPALLRTVFTQAGQPLELDDLVGLIADGQGLTDKPFVRGAQAEVEFAQVADQCTSVVDDLTARAYLQQLWREITQMTPRHCAALLLNLRDEQGGTAIDLLLTMGIASCEQIAAAMAMTTAEFVALWKHLPLEDAAIAARLQLTRQQVINLRRSARERLARRLQQAGF
ncbi:MAG: hypothetical protein U0Y68_14665 [Blastocatellia bacterium]